MIVLRGYQVGLINSVREKIRYGFKKVLLTLPTGGGKTYIMADIAKRCIDNGHKVLALMHRRQLVQQMQDRFSDYEIDSGIIMSGEDTELRKNMQIATIQTYHRRLQLDDVKENRFFIDASVVLVDEAHRSLSKTYLETLFHYEDKIIIGVTATPCLASGLGMGNYYDALVDEVGVQGLIASGDLVPVRYYAPSQPDLNKIRTVAGDYEKKELGKRVNNKKLIGDVFDNWARLAGDLQTIGFAVNVKHSRALCEEFTRNGVVAEHLDAHSSEDRREDVLNRLIAGDVQVVWNVGLYTEGFDYPGAGCIVLARPTKSMGLYRQMAGRGLRPYEGKKECVIIDHGGCIDRLGFIEDDVSWSLDGKELGYKKKLRRTKEKTLMTCDYCAFVFTGKTCPQCGAEIKDYNKKINALEAKLVEIGKRNKKYTMADKRRWYGMFEYYRRSKGFQQGWTAHKYREKFEVWPRGVDDVGPIPPDQGFKNYMKHLSIKWAKSKENREQAA